MTELTRGERAHARRYTLHMAGASVLFLVLMLFLPLEPEPGTPLALVIALVPLVAVAWMVFAVVQFVRSLDEFMRPRAMTAAAIAFVAAMVASVVFGMLDAEIGPLPLATWGVFVVGMITWGAAMLGMNLRGNK
ncbi:hypothetical protein [Leucobacter komagatae]|uniref:Uncharacterized protein n=1 Tax=Leucobacter komagatae TaxID=55969 RepID=A0A0D0ILH6_9MICO|nr:hypothetical protein [Leucobacter komagatae]KIP52439.1 hypothetical protein SD72_09490 [Leucobacter komagatae]